MKKNLIWFRNDLRIHDNTALHAACKTYTDQVIALFIATPQQWSYHDISIKKISFIYQNLVFLQHELRNLNINLYYYQSTTFTKSVEYLLYFCEKHQITNIFYNYQYEFNERIRDVLVKKKLSERKIIVQGFHDSLLVSYKKVHNKEQQAYKKYFPFKKRITHILYNETPKCFPKLIKRIPCASSFSDPLLSSYYKINFDVHLFPVGEKAAQNRLKEFFQKKLHTYSITRNFPALNNTSMLSPYLSLGILSSRYCFLTLLHACKNILDTVLTSSWMNEMIWREFYYHLLIEYPLLSKHQSLNTWEKHINWIDNLHNFSAWKKGETGFPIVDAGMRQLKKIGWMHNRLRMITASFLVKNLHINWRKGEKYFMSQLIDGDLALNNGGWQWISSIGSDSVPYIRIFNPLRQSQTYDKLGGFIRQFLPELKNVPSSHIHQPHEWAKKNNVELKYPKPIIDYQSTKKISLLMFNQARFMVSSERKTCV